MRKLLSALMVGCMSATAVFAHGDNSHFANKQDVTVKTTKVSGNVYMLQGRGGNIGAINGPDGLLIIDDDYKVVSEKLAAALKELGSASPRFILNTHWHGDHTEGNDVFGRGGSTIIAHSNVRRRMMDPPVVFGRRAEPYASHALPIVTYTESMSIHLNGDEIKVLHYPRGHTDGDSVVHFVKANVVHFGDHFFVGRFPFIDLASGGNVQGLINNIAAMIAKFPADAKLIPGHGPLATMDDLKAYHQLLVESTTVIQNAMKAGKSVEEIKKAGLPDKFKEAGSGFIKTDLWIDIVYQSYSQK
jgi:glyoxylase-like metal-dependent hydrolase (beta-lactamase superfamily II)